MTPIDTSALRALQEAMERKKPYYPEWFSVRFEYQEALVNGAPDLLNELDQLREARALAWESGLNAGIGYAPFMGKPGFDEPTNPFLSIPAEPKAGE